MSGMGVKEWDNESGARVLRRRLLMEDAKWITSGPA